MNSIFAVITLALKYYMVAQLQGDSGLAYFGFGHNSINSREGARSTFGAPFSPSSPRRSVPRLPLFLFLLCLCCFLVLLPPGHRRFNPPSTLILAPVIVPAPTSTYKYAPIEDLLEEPSCISMIFIVVLILSTIGVAIGDLISSTSRSVALQTEPSTKGAAEGSHRSVSTWSVLSCILIAACFGRVPVPSSLFERILDVLYFFLLFSFLCASFDTAHRQRTSHISSESIFADMLSTSIAIESSIEEANTKMNVRTPRFLASAP
ncbi:hypothetical protein ACEPAG_8788 [Sanghuangporus baumii]